MSGWLPGRLYRATVRGVPDVLVGRDSVDGMWVSIRVADGNRHHTDTQVTDVRGPVYVLELDEQDARVAARWAERPTVGALATIGRQVAAQIPKPPRMAEPGWGAKVIARTARTQVPADLACIWLRTSPDPGGQYICLHGDSAVWFELIDPEPVGGES